MSPLSIDLWNWHTFKCTSTRQSYCCLCLNYSSIASEPFEWFDENELIMCFSSPSSCYHHVYILISNCKFFQLRIWRHTTSCKMNCECFFPSPTTTIFLFIRRGDDLRTKMKKKSSLRLKLLVSTQSSSHDVRRLHDNEMCELLGRKVADASWDEWEIWNSCDTKNSIIYGHDREAQREIW